MIELTVTEIHNDKRWASEYKNRALPLSLVLPAVNPRRNWIRHGPKPDFLLSGRLLGRGKRRIRSKSIEIPSQAGFHELQRKIQAFDIDPDDLSAVYILRTFLDNDGLSKNHG